MSDNDLKNKLDNVCFTIFSEIKHLELYIELLGKFDIKGNSNSELIKIIKNSFGFQIASIFSRIVEKPSRNSANIFYIKNIIDSNMNNLSRDKSEQNILRKLSSGIDGFVKKYKVDIEVFADIKEVKISHNDLMLAKLKQEKRLQFSLVRMKEIKNYLINIFKEFDHEENFKKETLNKIINEADLFCSNFTL